jgi:Zn-dependent peptidase ImmA (M78 family)/transcriptional regulator with XRE-family HTH domain
MGQVATIGERLRYARERMGLTQGQAKDRSGVGESSLSEFEHGKREPTLSQLAKLAEAYQRPSSFFLDATPIPREEVRWRKKPTAQAEIVEAQFLRLCGQYHNLEAWCGQRATAELTPAGPPDAAINRTFAEALAHRVRKDLGLGEYPAFGFLEALEEQFGLKVFHHDFKPSGTAACTQHPTFGPAVLLNSNNPRWRRHFDLAHELFHLLTWDLLRPASTAAAGTWSESDEKLADAFAASLLLPAESVRQAVTQRAREGKLSLASVFEIARLFDVSVESTIWRIHVIRGGTPETNTKTKAAIKKAKQVAPEYETRSDTPPPGRPARFVALAQLALRRGELSAGRYAEYVGVSRQQALRLVEQEHGDDEALELPAP